MMVKRDKDTRTPSEILADRRGQAPKPSEEQVASRERQKERRQDAQRRDRNDDED